MVSRSCRQRKGTSVAPEHAAVLLRDGFKTSTPSVELVKAAEEIRAWGLIKFRIQEYVVCSEPRDRDFPPKNRHCRGRIYLNDGLDEDGDDFRCPKCERVVLPYRYRKIRHEEIQVHVCRDGIISYVHDRLKKLKTTVRDLGNGAFRLDDFGRMGIVVCVIDYCDDESINSRDWAAENPVCYITVNPRLFEGRFLNEDWICRVSLVDLIAERVDLRKTITEIADAPVPQTFNKVSIPVCAKGHVLIQPVETPHPDRLFFVELDEKTVRVNGEIVVNPQAGPRLMVFRILWERFLEDIESGLPASEFRAANLRELLNLMEEASKRYDDETTLRKVINNLQGDIEKAVKRKLGLPIGREDIVQTCRMTSQTDADGGYRINPFSVAVRPVQAR